MDDQASADAQKLGAASNTSDEVRVFFDRVSSEIAKVVVGQEELVTTALIALVSGGHVLIEGVPGLGKTLFVKTLGRVIGCKFGRIQFTADLMPSDVTGAPIFDMKLQDFRFRPGPVFVQLLLADEINRSPAKTHAALLEIMQESRVTIDGVTHPVPSPFLVFATQNPLESEGTYSLPEAQLDRFMFLVELDYPNEEEEIQIARTTTGDDMVKLQGVLSGEEILHYQRLVRRIPVADHIYEYAAKLVRKTRPQSSTAPDWLKPFVSWGAGPRAVQNLILGAKSRAALQGSYMVRLEDVQYVAKPVLVHRLITTFAAQAEGVSAKQIVSRLIDETR